MNYVGKVFIVGLFVEGGGKGVYLIWELGMGRMLGIVGIEISRER